MQCFKGFRGEGRKSWSRSPRSQAWLRAHMGSGEAANSGRLVANMGPRAYGAGLCGEPSSASMAGGGVCFRAGHPGLGTRRFREPP